MKLVYFSWVRERIGMPQEDVAPPESVRTVRELLEWLKTRGEGYAAALRHTEAIRVAINQEHAGHDAQIAGAREVGLFPPMSGG